MNFWCLSFSIVCLLIISRAQSVYDPCTSRGVIGDKCDVNGDCNGFGVVCTEGVCQCHQDYKETKDDFDNSLKVCVKLPDKIGARCIGSCKFPLFCQGGFCACIRAKIISGQCIPDFPLGIQCTRNAECSQPFSACIQGQCRCVAGSTQIGDSCAASPNCPSGAPPRGTCYRRSGNKIVIQNLVNSGGVIDNCTDNSFCYTSDVSDFGVCCPATCPMSMTPDNDFSCDPTVPEDAACPSDTHYCHRQAGQSHSVTICCRKPCREPTPVFIKGQCFPRSFLKGPCVVDEQCDGGYGMSCTGGLCTCNAGFAPYADEFISAENQPQTCVRVCSSLAYGGECFPRSNVDQLCLIHQQCPEGSVCFRGRCLCSCNKGYLKQNNNCVKQAAPATSQLAQPVEAAAPKTSNNILSSNNNNFLSIIQGLLGINPNPPKTRTFYD